MESWLAGTDARTMLTIVGLTCVTVLTRAFFVIFEKDWSLPAWVQRGLQYAPIAALAAVIVPEVVMLQGHMIHSWQDARLFAACAGLAFFFWRRGRGQAVLGTIVSGMLVYLPLHLGLGW